MSLRPADDDGASWRTRDRRRRDDIAFLEAVRMAVETDDIGRLMTLAEHHEHKDAPHWKRIAIDRAIAKLNDRAYAARATDRGHDDQ